MNEQKDSGGDVRDHILEAACERFGQYGYNKTTMAEIAKDCDMSASNIYRFFENKLQIGATLASDCLAERVANMRLEIESTGLSCETRLRKLIHRMFQDTYEQMSDHPKINELVVAVCNEKPDIVKQHARNKREIVEHLLHEAVAAGEFQSQDISRSARAVLTATVLFDMPLLLSTYNEQEIQEKADELCDLLLDGLKKQR